MAKIIGYDKDGIRRVYSIHSNIDVAETRCIEAIQRYLKKRPDTGVLGKPLFGWRLESEASDGTFHSLPSI